jgi:dinuclear metal center YbgI/SA1388 family protein
MKISAIISAIERVAPSNYQESYDNSGLLVGDANAEVSGVLVCLDVLETVVEEAHNLGINMIVAHHPIIFSGLKRLTGRTYIERVVIKAISYGIAIYAVHTNLDNVLQGGVNERIGQQLGLENTKILAPKAGLIRKLCTYVPTASADAVRAALFAAGAGQIGAYSSCSFNMQGVGTFLANESANPYVGQRGELHREAEEKIEVLFLEQQQSAIIKALLSAHPYEEAAYDIIKLENTAAEVGAGLIGQLPKPVPVAEFLQTLKQKMKVGCIKYTAPHKDTISTVALCGGAGGFLLRQAIGKQADIFITADYKYHEFFDAEGKIIIADIGHYESEQYTIDLLAELLSKQFENLRVEMVTQTTNPVLYL